MRCTRYTLTHEQAQPVHWRRSPVSLLPLAHVACSAINDGILLEAQIYRLLRRHFSAC